MALMMEAASNSETSVTSTRLHGATIQQTAILKALRKLCGSEREKVTKERRK
jgi:hypothetical protein